MAVKRERSDDPLDESVSHLYSVCDSLLGSVERETVGVKRTKMDDERRRKDDEARLRDREEHLCALKARRDLFVPASADDVVRLEVGGEAFTTTVSTLAAVPGTLFDVLLSGRFDVERNPETDAIVLDRSPLHFSTVLNYLRGCRAGGVAQPEFTLRGFSASDALEIAIEADYYGLEDLRVMAQNCTSLVVSQEVDATYRSVHEALSVAKDGDRIVVYPGTYFESIRVAKDVEVCGVGPTDKIVLVSTDGTPTASFVGSCRGRLVGISLREMSRFGVCTLEVSGSSCAVIEGCDMTTRQEANAVNVTEQGELTLRGCYIHGAKGSAVMLRDNASAVIEDNKLVNIGCCGVQARHNATYTLQGNTISSAAFGGVEANENSRGTIGNNTITRCKRGGILLHGSAHATIQSNVIKENEYGIRSFGNPHAAVLKGNLVSHSTHEDLKGVCEAEGVHPASPVTPH
eukprot:TRINITY_DN22490_c0_g1_i1.p1 TRINITY_DN22490_c0_g1~~TRINITY_DN22490_c0_g1_i1.p1  ORF type:complete len:460 (+),score=158.59 TRINITY_DN22490_c0_g1_i1:75-1454(+)